MRVVLSLLLLVLPLSVGAAPGDVISLTIRPDGWSAALVVEGYDTNCAWEFGWASNNVPTASTKMKLTGYCPGFEDDGSSNWTARVIYGTKPVRFPYPAQDYADQNRSATHVTNRIALSDWLYAPDGNIHVTIRNGMYSNSASWSGDGANASAAVYQKPVANWSLPPYRLVSTTNCDVRLVAYGHGARNGRPVRSVHVWAEDESGHVSPTNILTHAVIVTGESDAAPVVEYQAQLDLSGLNNSNVVTAQFMVFPWVGDKNAILFTGDGRFSFPSFECTSTKVFYCTNFPRQIAVVETNGVDANGRVVDASSFDTDSPPVAFRTIGAAARAIAGTNVALYGVGRCDTSGGIIYLRAGNWRVSEATLTGANLITNNNCTYCTVTPYPGVDRASVVITNSNSTKNWGSMCKLQGVTIGSVAAPVTFDNIDYFWADGCWFTTNTTDTRLIDSVTNVYVTHCRIEGLPQGLVQPASAYAGNYFLIRGNDFSGFSGPIHPSTVLGNVRLSGTNGAVTVAWPTSSTLPGSPYPIVSYNRFLAEFSPTAHIIRIGEPSTPCKITNGAAIIQNVVEQVGGSSAGRTFSIGSSTASSDDTNTTPNILCWYNTSVGQRMNWQEGAGGAASSSVQAHREYCELLNNLGDNINSKDDLDYTANGSRTNSWHVMYGVGASGNIDLEAYGMDSYWNWEFAGVCSYWFGNAGNTDATNMPAYFDREAGDGVATIRPGGGDYRVKSESFLQTRQTRWVLPFDLEGCRRGEMDPPGAYCSGQPRKGAGFFQ